MKTNLFGFAYSISSCFSYNTIFNDAPQPFQFGFQDSAAPGFTGLVTLHNTIGFYLIVILLAVTWVLFSIMYYYSSNQNPIAQHKIIGMSLIKDSHFYLPFLFTLLILNYYSLLDQKLYFYSFIGFIIGKLYKQIRTQKWKEIFISIFVYLFIGYFFGLFQMETLYCSDGSEDLTKKIKENTLTVSASSQTMNKILDLAGQAMAEGAVGIGAGILGAKLGTSSMLANAGLPPLQKSAIGVATGVAAYALTSASQILLKNTLSANTKMDPLKEILKNELANSITNSNPANAEVVAKSINIIPSMLSGNEITSPLQTIISVEISLCLIILFNILIILIVLIAKHIGSKNFLHKLLANYGSTKYKFLYDKYVKLQSIFTKFNNNFYIIIIIINVLMLILSVLLLIYANLNLSLNINEYVDIHNHIHNRRIK